MAKKILIVDDHPFLRMGVRTFLENNFNDLACEEADTIASAKEASKKHTFDFAFVDISLGKENGLHLAEYLKKEQPPCRVIVLSMHKEPLLVKKARDSGLDGFLVKEDAFDLFKKALESPPETGFILSGSIDPAVISDEKGDSTTSLISSYNSLTGREKSIFRLLAEGFSCKETAFELGIKQKTALVHRSNLMKKMDLTDQTDIVKTAIKLGLIDPLA